MSISSTLRRISPKLPESRIHGQQNNVMASADYCASIKQVMEKTSPILEIAKNLEISGSKGYAKSMQKGKEQRKKERKKQRGNKAD
jgi:ABC-type uncharacterized transport system ATPase component